MLSIKKIVKIIIAILAACIAYICLSLSPIFFKDYSTEINSKKECRIIGHRGASQLAPENTIASVNTALKLNLDTIEIDVQQTSDSVVVLMHDTSLNRTSNGNGLIKEKTFQKLSNLDAGSWFSSDFLNEKIPTLEDVLKLVNGKCKLIIEIKKGHDFYPNIEKNILNLIKKHHAEQWVIIHSFDYKILKRVHVINPNIPLQKLFVGKLKFIPFIVSNRLEKLEIEKHPYIETYSINYLFCNKEIIHLLKSNNKKIHVWTVNNSNTANELIALGVDGIITDNHKLLKN